MLPTNISGCINRKFVYLNDNMENKIRQNVKSNYFLKKYSIEKIKNLTNMSLSDINDRLMDGLGIISDKDALVLSEAKALKPFLRKYAFGKI